MAGWVMSARRVVMPGRGDMGWRSMATILTSFLSVMGGVCAESEGSFGVVVLGLWSLLPRTLSNCCRSFSCLSSQAILPNFSPLIKTRDKT